ncbi:MAG: mepA [Hyphomicrobiales bacterium]|nr:mepA [Hyphomicrobiales bacterium]
MAVSPLYGRCWLALAAVLATGVAHAQERGSQEPKTLPALAHPEDPATPAKELFGRVRVASAGPTHTFGFYSRGCMAGAKALPIDGDAWQVMRLSRNRNWGQPAMISFLESLARKARGQNIWPGLLVGDMAQPRGGPMITGHASHQIGLDADVWLTPMPGHTLTRAEREETSATNLVREDWLDVDPQKWRPEHMALLKLAASQPQVERIFVNPAIKKAICRDVQGDRKWLNKIRPMYGHNYHFHIRLACPAGEASCRAQDPVPAGDGCDSTLAWWFSDEVLHPKPKPPGKKPQPITMAQLPNECRAVLNAP